MLTTLLIALTVFIIWFSTRYKWWRKAIVSTHPRILMYHMVREHIEGARFNGLRVTPSAFERQLRWFVDNNWQFWFLSDVINADTMPPNVVAITFDDGFADNYINALPLLQKYGAKATLFLVEERADNDWSSKKKSHHDSGELMREPKLTDQQVQEMIASGCFEIGGHSLTHADFSKLTPAQKRAELERSQQIQTQKFPHSHQSYAYTFGIYDTHDVELVRELGYRGAVTTKEGISIDRDAERYELRRVKVAGKKNFLHFKLSLRTGPGVLFK